MSKMCPTAQQYNSKLAAFTFFARQIPSWEFGSNGLPLTPNSIAILGRSQLLKDILHPNLCQYLDIIRGKHERLIVVSHYYGTPVNEKHSDQINTDLVLSILYQAASGLDHLSQNEMVHHNLEPANILLDDLNNVKLFNYGLYYMTNGGKYTSFPVGRVKYLPPERILGLDDNIKSDVWSLGIVAIELLLGCTLWSSLKLAQVMRKILSFTSTKNVFEKIAREHDCYEKYQSLALPLRQLLESCLSIATKDRPTPEAILQHEVFHGKTEICGYKTPAKPVNLMERLDLKILYYLYLLAGGDVEAELKKQGLVRNEAPILSMPKLVLLNGKTVGQTKTQSCLFDDRIVFLSLSNLTERLSTISKRAYFPLIHAPQFAVNYSAEMQKLPLVIRERDTEYQFHRVILFTRLMKGYPYTRDLIIKEAEIDIPPLLRGQIWACILGVLETGNYEKIDKVTPTPTDRQIDVDIPRCHQYNEFLASPTGHAKLKRLLKSWVKSHPQYVYWQGLDSLTAPFLFLNFNNEERAFSCLYKFIPKYLHWFFLKDNSMVIKEYLSKFSQLTTYHEPMMARHMKNIHFIPELFAIPWFLTMFSHVFPLHKIIHLWDKLIAIGDNSYPLFIGISVLKQLKSTLLSSGFNECILLFSDLPDIVMEQSMIESQKMYVVTPKSVCHRKFVLREHEPDALDINDDVELSDLQTEMCPRISANDLVKLLKEVPNRLAIVDLRSTLEFNRMRIVNSINIPFTSVSLSDIRLDSLNVVDLDKQLANQIVVIVSVSHENAVLFSKFLVDCEVSRVCVLHKGFNILQTINPSVLMVA